MKKLYCVVLLIIFTLVGCNKHDERIVGQWQGKGKVGDISLAFSTGGTGQAHYAADKRANFNWIALDDGKILAKDGKDVLTFYFKGSKLFMEIKDGTDNDCFERVKQ